MVRVSQIRSRHTGCGRWHFPFLEIMQDDYWSFVLARLVVFMRFPDFTAIDSFIDLLPVTPD